MGRLYQLERPRDGSTWALQTDEPSVQELLEQREPALRSLRQHEALSQLSRLRAAQVLEREQRRLEQLAGPAWEQQAQPRRAQRHTDRLSDASRDRDDLQVRRLQKQARPPPAAEFHSSRQNVAILDRKHQLSLELRQARPDDASHEVARYLTRVQVIHELRNRSNGREEPEACPRVFAR